MESGPVKIQEIDHDEKNQPVRGEIKPVLIGGYDPLGLPNASADPLRRVKPVGR